MTRIQAPSRTFKFGDFHLHICEYTVGPFGLGLNLFKENVRALLTRFLNLSGMKTNDNEYQRKMLRPLFGFSFKDFIGGGEQDLTGERTLEFTPSSAIHTASLTLTFYHSNYRVLLFSSPSQTRFRLTLQKPSPDAIALVLRKCQQLTHLQTELQFHSLR